jgi:hypothetical protein
MAKTLDQVVNKWTTNAQGAGQAWLDGINGTTVDPTALAAANSAGYLAGVQLAVSSGLWQRRLAAAGKAKWLSQSIAKQGNYGTGIDAGKDNYLQAMTTWLPAIQQAGAAAKQMPGQTIDQRIGRSAYVQRTLYNRKRGL